jgi:capsular exopolysaccharide synthesis family protein
MDELTKYEGGVLGPTITEFPPLPESAGPSAIDVLTSVLLRRWRIVVIVFAAICGVGLPVIWLGLESAYEVTGAIRVAPILSNILTGEVDRGEISNYQSFMNTQAEMVVSTQVIHRVADDLADKNLSFFDSQSADVVDKVEQQIGGTGKKVDFVARLKDAIADGAITVIPARNTELIKITMRTAKPEEARVIVDAFVRAYMAVEGLRSTQDEDQKLQVLESERRNLADKMQSQREAIRQLAQEFGTAALDDRQKMMLERVSSILIELTKVEAQRINVEARIQALEQGKEQGLPDELLNKRKEYINSDPALQELVRNIVRQEQDLIAARQLMTPENPLLKQKEEFIESFRKRLDERRQEAGKEFDALIAEDANLAARNRLLNARAELEQVSAYESRLREKLAKEDAQTIEVGRKQLNIQDMQYQLERDKQMYETVMRRIQEMEMERKQPARISIAYPADINPVRDKRIKYTAALIFVALVGGAGLAFLRDKSDQSLQTPEDIVRRIGIRIIGTTTSPKTVERTLLPRQLIEDYQTIRANLGLLDGDGMPKKLVVTSPGMRDGKTTFAINLATSLSRSGRKVLLVDGDMRKPDIGRLLNVPRNMRWLQDVLMGTPSDDSVIAIVSPGLHVLAAGSQSSVDPYELLVLPGTAELINSLSNRYDHVIIDTPPVLAFPDALIWAKIAGAVILTSFAGYTTGPDLKESRDRFSQINVRILGTVMVNVHVSHTYYRYGYHYYAQEGRPKRDSSRKGISPLLLPSEKPKDDSGKPTS